MANVGSTLRDEGGLLSDIAEHPVARNAPVQQKVSSTGISESYSMTAFALTVCSGKRYLALQVPTSGNIETESSGATIFM